MDLEVQVEPLPEGEWVDVHTVEAFDVLYRSCHRELVAMCRRLLCGRGDPEAIAQEAFIRAWASFDRFSSARPFWPWLATIARRLCIDHRRRLAREQTHVATAWAWGSAAVAPSPEEAAEQREEHRSAFEALQRLKPSERRLLTLREVNGWTYDQIARFEGVTIESVRGSLKRARTSLRCSYDAVSGELRAVVGLGAFARLRARAHRLVGRHSAVAAPTSMSLHTWPDALVGAVALVVGVTGGGAATYRAATAIGGPDLAVASTANPVEQLQASGGGVLDAASGSAPDVPDEPMGSSPLSVPAVPGLLDDGGSAPEASSVDHITFSPQSEQDGTVFITGTVTGCPYPPCSAVFRSPDRGVTWTRLPATGFVGGEVLLPPAFPQDGRIFVSGPAGLQVSTDGGVSFRTVSPAGGSAAVSPRFSSGDPRIIVAASPLWEYRDDTRVGAPALLAFAPSGTGGVAFAPDADGRRIVVGGTSADASEPQRATLFDCVDNVCARKASLGAMRGAPLVAVAPDVSASGLLFAWRGNSLFRSADGGATARPVELPVEGTIRSVVFSGPRTVFLGLVPGPSAGSGGVFRSVDGGVSWERVGAGAGLEAGASALAASGRRLFAAPAFEAGGGILCSSDGGATWARRCPS